MGAEAARDTEFSNAIESSRVTEETLPTATEMHRRESPHTHGVRTQADASVPAGEALEMLKEGNLRYVEGRPLERNFHADARQALAQHGQNPFATVIGCADSRCPIEILFDVQPGDIFVLRNAGNTCTHAEGSLVGSVEYSVGHLHTNLVLVLGHTKCGAIAGATSVAMSQNEKTADSENDQKGSNGSAGSLTNLLQGLAPVAKMAAAELPKGA